MRSSTIIIESNRYFKKHFKNITTTILKYFLPFVLIKFIYYEIPIANPYYLATNIIHFTSLVTITYIFTKASFESISQTTISGETGRARRAILVLFIFYIPTILMVSAGNHFFLREADGALITYKSFLDILILVYSLAGFAIFQFSYFQNAGFIPSLKKSAKTIKKNFWLIIPVLFLYNVIDSVLETSIILFIDEITYSSNQVISFAGRLISRLLRGFISGFYFALIVHVNCIVVSLNASGKLTEIKAFENDVIEENNV